MYKKDAGHIPHILYKNGLKINHGANLKSKTLKLLEKKTEEKVCVTLDMINF